MTTSFERPMAQVVGWSLSSSGQGLASQWLYESPMVFTRFLIPPVSGVEKTEEELAMERELQAETEAKAAAKNGESNVINCFGETIDIDDI